MFKNKKYHFIIYTLIFLIFTVIYGYLYNSQKKTKEYLEYKIYNYKKILCKKQVIFKEKQLIDNIYRKSQNIFIQTKNEADASIKLQEILSKVTEESNISINRIEAPNIFEDKNSVKFVGMRIYFTSNGESLLKFLYNIESSQHPYLIIDSINFNKIKIIRNHKTYYQLKGSIFIKALLKIGD